MSYVFYIQKERDEESAVNLHKMSLKLPPELIV